MANRNFREMLEAKWAKGKFVCVGLDSEVSKIPTTLIPNGKYIKYGDLQVAFNRAIVETTKDLVCAYKPNFAFYLHCGGGLVALQRTVKHIKTEVSDVPIVLDCKDADIGNTNNGYAEYFFDRLGVDAITVNPYLGREALEQFLKYKDKGIIVLCRTSNPGAGEFQDLEVRRRDHLSHLHPEDDRWVPFFIDVARRVVGEWNQNGNCGFVVGATAPEELGEVRKIVGDMPILIPGIGAQGGDLEATVNSGKDSRGRGMIINSSRGIIFASSGPDFAEAARRETLKLHKAINHCLAPPCGICGSMMVRSLGIWKCLNCGAITDVFKE